MANQPTKYKKFVATAATATLVASAIVPVASAATPEFSDITTYSADVQAAINALATQGIINGTSATTFEPGKEITRGQVVKLLGKWVESKGAVAPANWKTVERFTDLPVNSADQELLKYAAIAYDAGVFQGSNGVLNSSGKISRENMALVLDRAYDKVFGTSLVELAANVTDVNVADLATAKTEAKPAIQALKDLEISVSANFNPKGNVTRANFATFLYRALNVKAAEAAVQSVTAINGKVTVKFTKTPDAVPAVTDFKVTQNINGKTTAINASSVSYDAAAKTAVLSVPTIYANEVDQNVSYTVGYKETATQTSASFQVAKVTEAKVDSVTALNSKQIQLVFNQEMDKTSVEDVTKYLFAAAPQGKVIAGYATALTTAKGSTAKLQDDKKTVIITLGNTEVAVTDVFKLNGILENKTSIGVALAAQSVKAVSGKVLEKDAIFAIKLDDTTAPTVSKVAVNESGDLVVTFNEQVNPAPGKVTVNGYSYNLAAAGPGTAVVAHDKGVSTATISKADLIDTAKAKLELGKSYTVAVSGQTDAYGKAAESVYTSSLTYSLTAVAPVLKSVTAVDEKSFILNFSEDLTLVGGGALTVQVNKGAKQLITTLTDTTFDGRKEGQYKVTLNAPADVVTDVIYDRAKNETTANLTVYIPGVKDAAGNITAAGSTSVALSKDVTKPSVEKAVSSGTALDVKLTEGITGITAANLATGSYILAENGRQIPVLAAGFTPDPIVAGNKDFTFTYATGVTGGLVEGNYTLVVKKDTLVDQSLNNGNKNDEIRIPFAVGTGLQVKPALLAPADASTTAGKIVVNFTAPVTYASVANYQNYQVDGVNIPSASTFVLDSTGQILTITLPEGTYTKTQDRVITINGARNLAGSLMDQNQAVASVKENEKIKLQNAKVVNGDIILTFNEDVNDGIPVGSKFTNTDFNIKVEGTTVIGYTVADFEDVNDVTKLAKNQIKITAPALTSFATGTITAEAVNDGTLVTDAAGNTIQVNGTVITATR